jgi:hypothetical protein
MAGPSPRRVEFEDLYSHGSVVDGGSPFDDIFHIAAGNMCSPFRTDYYKYEDGHWDGFQSGGDGVPYAYCTVRDGLHGDPTLTCGDGTYQEVMYCSTNEGWCSMDVNLEGRKNNNEWTRVRVKEWP